MSGSMDSKKILVVDDEETVGLGISEILKDEGFEACYVTSGHRALEAVRETDYSLVFMDMVMPGMSGLDTYREMKKIRPAIKVVLLTGYYKDTRGEIEEAVAEGMIDELIRKPYFADEIISSAKKYTS